MIVVKYLFICGICDGVSSTESGVIPLHGQIMKPVLPHGWHEYDGMPVCNKHTVKWETP